MVRFMEEEKNYFYMIWLVLDIYIMMMMMVKKMRSVANIAWLDCRGRWPFHIPSPINRNYHHHHHQYNQQWPLHHSLHHIHSQDHKHIIPKTLRDLSARPHILFSASVVELEPECQHNCHSADLELCIKKTSRPFNNCFRFEIHYMPVPTIFHHQNRQKD